MDKDEYRQLLKDWRWQDRRLEILERDDFTCQDCGATADDGVLLQVHHKYYIDGNMPWEYDDDALVTLCEDCHKERHRYGDIDIY